MSGDDRGRPASPDGLVLEAWSQGFMVGSLFIFAVLVISNMRRHILLHKLILTELILGMPHGTFIFAKNPVYGWYLGATAVTLCVSWSLHNVIAWMKNKPFLSRTASMIYIGTVILVQPYWVLEVYTNFSYYNNIDSLFEKTRPFEPFFRDPWWIVTVCHLFYVIKKQYSLTIVELISVSPRFGIMLISMCLSVAFMILEVCCVLNVFPLNSPDGVQPFWKLSFIFKCLCDVIILDDFKSALDRIRKKWLYKTGACNIVSGGLTLVNETPVRPEDIEAGIGRSESA